MAKVKNREDIEHLKGIIRNQSKQIKHLQKELARATKHANKRVAEEQFVDTVDEVPDLLNPNNCPACGKHINPIDLGPRKIYNCSCGHRRVEVIK